MGLISSKSVKITKSGPEMGGFAQLITRFIPAASRIRVSSLLFAYNLENMSIPVALPGLSSSSNPRSPTPRYATQHSEFDRDARAERLQRRREQVAKSVARAGDGTTATT